MTDIKIDDKRLFEIIQNISEINYEIRSYIISADNQFDFAKQKLLAIPNNVANGKIDATKKAKFINLLNKMIEYEWLLTATGDKYRANSIHQIRVFLLGFVLLYKCGFRNLITELPKKERGNFNDSDIDIIWLYASLFHDIGYLLEKLNQIQDKIRSWTSEFSIVTTKCDISMKANDQMKVDETIRILSTSSQLDIKYFKDGYDNNDHGILSALIVRDEFGEIWRQSYINIGIQAMAIHNLKREAILFNKNPFAFLLMLCDEIQEWERPSRMWGHFQLINPIKQITLKNKPNNPGKINLQIYYDFSTPRIIKELNEYDKEFKSINQVRKKTPDHIDQWSEKEFLAVKQIDLQKKIHCGDLIEISFLVKTRDKKKITLRSQPNNWILED